jgi:hypothetical protein
MPTTLSFDTAVVGRCEDGALSIALLQRLEPPHDGQRACVAIIECSPETAAALCRQVSSIVSIEGK